MSVEDVVSPVDRSAQTPGQRIAFRFVAVYIPLYFLPGWLWKPVVPFFGHHVLGITAPLADHSIASSDSLYSYVLALLRIIVALVFAAGWSLRSKKLDYTKEHEVLRVFTRYLVASYMMMYGMSKFFPTQFAAPGPEQMLERLGDFSPMSLLWTFMGYSAVYSIFTGAAELLGGFLLFFRRTAMLGALINLGVMANVVMLNFCYDVPVKIVSTHLFLMNGFLVFPDLRRLLHFFVLGRVPAPAAPPPEFSKRLLRVMRILRPIYITLITLILFGFTGSFFWRGRLAPHPPLYGAYEVESFARNGQTIPPSLEEPTRWRYVAINHWMDFTAIQMNEERKMLDAREDAEKKMLTLSTPKGDESNASQPIELAYTTPDPGHLTLRGRYDGDEITVHLRRIEESKLVLLSREFHWINEKPFYH